MKSCPYCAESIQEAAVKCRFCGEWLDPDRRPPWSVDINSLGQLLVEVLGNGPDAGNDGETPPELGVPMPRSEPNWDETSDSGDEEPIDDGIKRTTTKLFGGHPVQQLGVQSSAIDEVSAAAEAAVESAARALDATQPAPPNPERDSWSTPSWLSSPSAAATASDGQTASQVVTASGDRAALEDVAERMERIKASAAVVRDALREQDTVATKPVTPASLAEIPEASDSVRAAMISEPARERTPTPPPPPKSKAAELAAGFFSEDSGLASADSVMTDSSMTGLGAMVAAPRPVPWGPIIAAGVVVSLIGMWTFKTQLFGDEPEQDVAAQTAKAVPAAEPAPPQPPPAQPSVPTMEAGGGQPVEPAPAGEGAPTGAEGAPADDAKQDGGATGAPLDADEIEQLDQARKLYKRQKLKKARSILEELLDSHPKQPDALLLMAQVQLEKAEIEDSLDTASRCVRVDPQLADCWLTIGVLQQELKDRDEAIAAYEKYLALAPEGSYAREVKTQLKRLNR